jgi:hypothetical protein
LMISVIGAINNPVLEIVSGGSPAVQLIIQTGSLLVEFIGTNPNDWTRDSLSYTIYTLPLATLPGHRINQATASASPSSFGCGSSLSYAGSDGFRVGPLPQNYPGGDPNVEAPQFLPVVGSAPVTIPGSGWAVDQTKAQISGRDVQLNANLAVYGACGIYRVSYSVFITVTLGPIDIHDHVPR